MRARTLSVAGGLLSGAALMLLTVSGCTDETIIRETVEVPREVFNPPPDSVAGLLGYFTASAKQTTCGNCHFGTQSTWEMTAHADAWNSLQASGSAQSFCEGCHSVSELGNALTEPAGYNAVPVEAYQDVQCESCHGPGVDHVLNPEATQPMASALVDTTITTGCAECHEGTHHPFVEEWLESPHSGVVTFAAARPECQACHRGQGTLEAWGANAEYLEKDSPEHLPVVCIVCHDPHDARNEGQLRFPVATASIEEHLCARCHNRRTIPDPASSHGLAPHAPESDLLVGDAGWFPPGATINQGQIRGTHGTERNAKLCATCHVSPLTVTDQATGAFVFQATGHLFRPIPCLDAEGKPLPFENACPITTTDRSFAACTAAGCHGDEGAAFSALTAAVGRIQARADELHSQLLQVDPNLEDAGGEIDPANPTFTVAEGALFNHNLATFGSSEFGTNTVVGSSVHNPFLVESLLLASIQAVKDTYGVNPTGLKSTVDWQAELKAVLDRVPE